MFVVEHMAVARPYEMLARDVQRTEPRNFKPIAEGVGAAVLTSFALCPARCTRSELLDRLDVAAELFQQLRRDVGWSTQRALDALPDALVADLRGEKYSPSKRASWIVRPTISDNRVVVTLDDVAAEIAREVMVRP